MAIPDGELYNSGQLAAGQLATIERATINTEQAGADIGFGQGVAIANGAVVPATGGNIFGVALRRTYLNADHLTQENIDADKWHAGEMLGVVREGTVQVPISADVEMNENAAVDQDGNFKPAGASDTVVGVFLNASNAGGTARMQTRIQFPAPAPQATQPAQPTTQPTQPTTNKNGGK